MSSGALITSDWHAHNWSRFATTLTSGVNSRFADLLATIDQMEEYIEEYEPRYLIHLGDLTHRRYFVQFSIFVPLIERLVRIVERYRVVIIILVGNHDRENETYHSLGPLKFIPGIRVIDQPTWIELEDFGHVFFCPYMDDEQVATAFREASVRAVSANTSRIAFTHYAFDGKAMGGGEYAVPSALRKSDAEHFEKIYLGHVHAPSIEDDERVIYVGAPLHFDFGDSGERFCWRLRTNTAEPRPLTLTAPRFVTTTYPRIAVPPLTSGFLRVLNTPANLFDDVKRSALDAGWLDCVPVEERMPHEAIRVLSSAVMADEQAVRSWVNRAYSEMTDDERSRIAEYGLDCLREAQR